MIKLTIMAMLLLLALSPVAVLAQGPAGSSGVVIIMSGSDNEPEPPAPPEPSAFDNAPPVDFSDPMVWGILGGMLLVSVVIYMVADIRRRIKKET